MLKKMTEEQQLFAAQNYKLIYGFLAKNNLDREEWYGIASFGFCKAVIAYDENKGVKFSVFAFLCMRNEVYMEYRKNKLKNSFTHISFDDVVSENLTYSDIIPSNQCLEEDTGTKIVVKEQLSKLKEVDILILKLKTGGATQQEIGIKAELSQAQICRRLKFIKQTLQLS